MRAEKETVRSFYESFGWEKVACRLYKDSLLFGDVRPTVLDHFARLYARAGGLLPSRGGLLLDVGSGPVAYPWSAEYSKSYRKHVCLDLSRAALREARSHLGDHGMFVVGDLASLPFKDGVFDGGVASHVLYHVPADEQEQAVRELRRTLARGGACVILYARPGSRRPKGARRFELRRLLGAAFRRSWRWVALRRGVSSAPRPIRGREKVPELYFHAHDVDWFERTFPREWNLDIRSWSLIGVDFTRSFIPDDWVGRIALRAIFLLESAFPHLSVRFGQYPMIIVRKEGACSLPHSAGGERAKSA